MNIEEEEVEVEYEDIWGVSNDIHELLEILIYTIKNSDENNKIKKKNQKINNFENKFDKLSTLINLHNELIMRENASKAAHIGILLERNAYAKKIISIEEELLRKSADDIDLNNVKCENIDQNIIHQQQFKQVVAKILHM